MIEIKALSRHFGELKAVDEISFEVHSGEILGFLGPNGAGKTTTMRMMVGFLQPTGGTISIDGKNINENPIETSAHIGYLPEHNPLYDEMIVYDYLKYMADLRGMNPVNFAERLRYVIGKCGLQAVMAQSIATLSKGYRQRLGLAQAIIHDPAILILDEPTSGLDPNQILEIRDLIRELGAHKTVILSSHIMQEVQALCDRVIIINKGKIIADDTVQNLSSGYGDKSQLVVEIEAEEPDLNELFALYPEVELVESSFENGVSTLVFESNADYDLKREIAKYMSKKGLLVLGMYSRQHSLEEVFHGLTTDLILPGANGPELQNTSEDVSLEEENPVEEDAIIDELPADIEINKEEEK